MPVDVCQKKGLWNAETQRIKTRPGSHWKWFLCDLLFLFVLSVHPLVAAGGRAVKSAAFFARLLVFLKQRAGLQQVIASCYNNPS